MRKSASVAAILALALAACDGPSAKDPVRSELPARETPAEPPFSTPPPPATRHVPVYSADSIVFEIRESMPVQLVIKARGTVRTGGWSAAELRPHGVAAPGATTLSFTFVALPPRPDMMVTQALAPIEASVTIPALPAGVKSIRIVAETNELTENLP